MKLVVEEGGVRRSFRMGEGKLTIGSGPDVRLRLVSPGVAEMHVELELAEGVAHLRPRPGVVAPRMGGVPLAGDTPVQPGQVILVGGAKLWLEDATTGAPPEQAGPGSSQPHRSRSVAKRTKPRIERGLPSWAVTALILSLTAVGVIVMARGFLSDAGEGAGPPRAAIDHAREDMALSNLDAAEVRLRAISEERMTEAEAEEVTALLGQIVERRSAAVLAQENLAGTRYLDMLKRYESTHLGGSPDRAKVRLFLQLTGSFRERWPRHPELGWAERQESRFEGVVVAGPPTWKDIRWEIRYLTGGKPRNYARAFELIDDFMLRGEGGDLLEAQSTWERLLSERAEYHADRMEQITHELERNQDPGKAVWWAVHEVIWSGDAGMADAAVEELLAIPDLDAHLGGYERSYPVRYAALLGNARILGYAREAGLVE